MMTQVKVHLTSKHITDFEQDMYERSHHSKVKKTPTELLINMSHQGGFGQLVYETALHIYVFIYLSFFKSAQHIF